MTIVIKLSEGIDHVGNKLFTIGIGVFGLVFLLNGLSYSDKQNQYVSSATFPTFIAILLIICTLILLAKQFYNKSKSEDKPEGITYRGLIIIGLMIVFYFVLPVIGFFIAGTLITMAFAYMLQTGKVRKFDTFIYPFIVTIVLIFFFNSLKIYLPTGFFF